MPCSPAKARLLLKEKKAIVKRRTPFTIQLTIATGEAKQPVALGVDSGYKHIGLSATTEKDELYASQVELRQDITDLLSARLALRRSRRSRKTRYRAPRFDNRVASKRKGWLAPSVENRIAAHMSRVEAVMRVLPVTAITIETAAFDTQLLKNPDIAGDIESRRTGGDAPNNLITLCETCHKAFHRGEIKLKVKRGKSFKAETFMGIMRWTLFERLKKAHPELRVRNTYGYLTKHKRISHGIAKSHCADAYCIADNLGAKRLEGFFFQKQTRKHNRQIHKLSILKGGLRKKNQAPYEVKGFRLFDKVICKGEEAFIFGRRTSGSFDVRRLDGTRISAGISCKKLRLLEPRTTYLTEFRKEAALPPLHECSGSRAEFR